MKLSEIISTQFGVKPYEPLDQSNEIGLGKYSSVSNDPDEHMVMKKDKQLKYRLKDDPYYTYIKAIADRQLSSENPYFPRVYNVDLETTEDGEVRPTYRIERLQKFDSFSSEVLIELGKRMVDNLSDYMRLDLWDETLPPEADICVSISELLDSSLALR